MYPSAFNYHRPGSMQDALRLLKDKSGAKLLAGGHSLIPLMKMRLTQPEDLIDLRDVKELKGIRLADDHLVIGAMTTHWEVQSSRLVRDKSPVLCEVAGGIGDPQVRNLGTIGGSLVHADPAADYPAIALAMEAVLVCRGAGGERTVKAADWFQSLMTTAINEDEVLVEVRFPLPKGSWGATYIKTPDPASRMAMIGVAAVVTLDGKGGAASVRLGVTGASSVPGRAVSVEQGVSGKKLEDEAVRKAAETIGKDIAFEPHRTCTAQDREQICKVQVRRAIAKAWQRANSSSRS
jgi:carbon-monoxide dehydrogenase medium subunit